MERSTWQAVPAMCFAERSGFGLNALLGRRNQACARSCGSPTPAPNSTPSLAREIGHAAAVSGATLLKRAAKNFHRTRSEADLAGRTLRRVAPVRSRDAARPAAYALPARAKRQLLRMREAIGSGEKPSHQQCGKQGLTPELSRAAKRHRLERFVRPPTPRLRQPNP